MAMVGAILILLILPFVETSRIRGLRFRPLGKIFFWLFVFDFFILTWIGQCTPDYPYDIIGLIGTIYYFSYFVFIVPVTGIIENTLNQVK